MSGYEAFWKGQELHNLGHKRREDEPNTCICGQPYHAHSEPIERIEAYRWCADPANRRWEVAA